MAVLLDEVLQFLTDNPASDYISVRAHVETIFGVTDNFSQRDMELWESRENFITSLVTGSTKTYTITQHGTDRLTPPV